MNDFETLDGLATEIVSDYIGPSDTNASDNSPPHKSSKRGKKSKSQSHIASDSDSVDTGGDGPVYQEMGAVMATSVISLCMILGGEEFRPDVGEPEAMAGAWASYFQAKGYNQFSPEVMLVMVTGGYVAKRLNMPQTKSRMNYYWEKFKAWRYARSNRGYYNQRQNNTSETPSEQPT